MTKRHGSKKLRGAEVRERTRLLGLYRDLRVADVRDGMDTLLRHHAGSMSPDIRPLFRTRAVGIARTVRYLPYEGPPADVPPNRYWAWVNWYYREICPYPFMEGIVPGDFCVIDQSGENVGLMGSNNTLGGIRAGCAGYVSNGGVRDTDEIILEKIPFWSKMTSHGMVQCRLRYDAMQVPVSVGGVTVIPGDVVVADGDGVIAVPRGIAAEVARWAHEEHARDKKSRRGLYEALGRPLDDTVR